MTPEEKEILADLKLFITLSKKYTEEECNTTLEIINSFIKINQ